MTVSIRIIALALILTTTAACGSTDRGLDLGIRRVALNLAFSEEELAEPVEPEVIVTLIPAPPGVEEPADLTRFEVRPDDPPSPPPDLSAVPACAEAPPGAAPREVVTATVSQPPPPGVYSRRNQGSIDVIGGAFPLSFPYPAQTTWEVSESERVEQGADLLGVAAGASTEWEVRKVVSQTFTITERYRLTEEAILLVSRTTDNAGEVRVLTPQPPVTYYEFGFEGDEWTSAGVDLETNAAIVRQGRIDRREVVDLCGEPVDTYRTEIMEQVVDLTTGEVSGTTDEGPNAINVATQYGGRVMQEEVHSSTHTTDPDSGTPVIVTFRYVSIASGIEPDGGR